MPTRNSEKSPASRARRASVGFVKTSKTSVKPEALLLDSVLVPVLGLGSLAESGVSFIQCSGQITDFWLAGFNRFSVLGLKLNLGEQ